MRVPPAVVLLTLLLGAGGAAAIALVNDPVPRGARTAPGPDGQPVLAAADGTPLLRSDGTPFPAGSIREGGEVVTPDGARWRRRAEGWVRVADGDRTATSAAQGDDGDPRGRGGDGSGRRHVASASPDGVPADGLVPRGEARLGASGGPAGETRTLDLSDLRPAGGPGGTVAVALDPETGLAPGWAQADATLLGAPDRNARTDVYQRPESAFGARRDRVDDQRGREEQAAVVAQRGLRGDYYDLVHGDLVEIPDVSGATPSFSRIDLKIDFSIDEEFALPFEPETFAVRWTGFLEAPEPGSYTFTCGSDDGMTLRIGDVAVVSYSWLRPYAETSGDVTLEAGLHPIEIVFYENRVFASARLFWKGPSWSKRIVDSRYLSPPAGLAGVVQPHVTRIDPAAARLGDAVTLTGVGFSATPGLDRVTFAGVEAKVIGAAESYLVVEVPLGAETGDVTVQVGELTSLPRKFTVDSVMGLFAEYFLIGQDLNVMPDLDALTPYFVRLDGPLDYHEDLLWALPYEPDVFAARYRGLLWVPEEDDYRVTLGSDDGAYVELDGAPYLGAPGLHPYVESERTSHFARGFHPIQITFFENRGVARLRLFWQRPGDVERKPIPRGFLFPPEDLVTARAPTVESVTPGAPGGVAVVTGSGFGTRPELARVEFPGPVWARPETIEDGRITVRVPWTAGDGELRVAVGIRSSNAVAFDRTTPIGLTADYYSFSSADEVRAASHVELSGRAPTLSRTETGLRRESAADWASIDMQDVVVHLHGTLGVDEAVDLGWILQADDGAFLFVDGRLVLDNGPFHGLQERFGESVLQPGRHAFDIWYYQADGDAKLHVFWNPRGLRDHRDVPDRWFQPAEPPSADPR